MIATLAIQTPLALLARTQVCTAIWGLASTIQLVLIIKGKPPEPLALVNCRRLSDIITMCR